MLAAPAVRRRARELNVDLQDVPATGNGRITHEDLDRHMATRSGAQLATAPRAGVEDIKIIGLRRRIAEKMQESKRHIPHITYVEELDLTELEALRLHLNAAGGAGRPKLSLLPFFVRAMVRALPEFPQINARYDDEAGILHRHAAVHIGIATQTPNGLLVPVVRHAETRDLWACAAEITRIATAAREGKATREELSGSTITLTSLGALGGVSTTPIINHPEVAIVGPNRLVERPVVRQGQIAIRRMMNLSSSFDHRIVDGHDAARFVQRLKGLLEHPATLFMDVP
jgi:2-oxoisovalerate dehydrogenase E2 component (dihydrolipoyl transacylase)